MAVFTTFSKAALARYLVMFDIGELAHYSPIEGGIENSNYFVALRSDDLVREFVLTITEELGFDEVGFFNDLLTQLSNAGLPVPLPQRTLDGMFSTIFCGKPAWLFPRLPGSHPMRANIAQCRAIGRALAQLHEAGHKARYSRANPYDLDWARTTFDEVRRHLNDADQKMLEAMLAEYGEVTETNGLPRGIIHGDLFRDNALFEGDKLTGIIDFYHACDDFLVQDVAIAINDWCTDTTGSLDEHRFNAILDGYESVRQLSHEERDCLPAFRRAGAARFVLTRLLSGDESGHLKDPREFLQIGRAAQSCE